MIGYGYLLAFMQKTFLDLGCGTGNQLEPLSGKHRVIGIDADAENIAVCRKKMPNGTWIVGDITHFDLRTVPLPTDIMCQEVLEHVPNYEAVIDSLDAAASGTRLHITVPYKISEEKLLKVKADYWKDIGHCHFFTGAELRSLLLSHGWTNIRIQRINAALYFELRLLLKRRAPCIRHTYYQNILPFPVRLFWQLFRPDLFHTKLKYLFPLWMITLPVGMMLNKFWGAGIAVRAVKQ